MGAEAGSANSCETRAIAAKAATDAFSLWWRHVAASPREEDCYEKKKVEICCGCQEKENCCKNKKSGEVGKIEVRHQERRIAVRTRVGKWAKKRGHFGADCCVVQREITV